MVDDEIQYEHQSVKVIRGREARKVAELEKQRWELVSQTQGSLRTEMTFRRVKKRSYEPWMGGVALMVLSVLLLAFSALGGDERPEPKNPPPTAENSTPDDRTNETSEAPGEEPSDSSVETPLDESSTPSEEPSEAEVVTPVNEVLSIRNSPDLKAMLEADDDYSLNKAFARTHKGRKIEFDGSVADATPGYYLVYFGDDSDTNATSGPAFQFRVRTLQAEGSPVMTGDNLRVVAAVRSFDADQGLFFLTPVNITRR